MNDESMVYNSKDKDANLDLEEKVVVTDNIKLAETNSKKDEDLKSKASKKTAETKNRAVALPKMCSKCLSNNCWNKQ
jgi:hypothetical protein